MGPRAEAGPRGEAGPRLRRFGHTVYRRTLVEPVQEGRLRDTGWPYGLRTIVAAGYLMFALAALLVIASGPIRASSPLLVTGTGVGLPRGVLWPMVVLLSFGLASFMAAALHGPWWFKLVGLGLTLTMTATWSLRTPGLAGSLWQPVAAGLIIAALLVFVLVRWRRPFVWWEFAVLWALTGAAMVIGVVEGRYGAVYGSDIRPASLQLTAAALGFLALPAATVAGAAVAEVTVRATLAATQSAQRLTGRGWPYAILGVVLGVRAVQVGWQVAHRDPVVDGWNAVLPAVLLVAAFALVGTVLLRLARRHTSVAQVAELPEELTRIGFGVSIALVSAVVPVLVVNVVLYIAVALDPTGAVGRSSVNLNPLLDRAVDPIRAVIGVVLLVFAVRAARRGRPGRALVLGSTAVMLVALARSLFLDGATVATIDPDAINLVSTVVVLVAAAASGLRRVLTRQRALGYAGILILSALFSYRDFISDPLGSLLGFSGAALVLFGLTWDLLTGAGWGNGESRRFGRPTRVLLVLTNAVLTMMVLAFAALIRDGSQTIYLDRYAELGDFVFGTALLAAAVIAVHAAAARDSAVA